VERRVRGGGEEGEDRKHLYGEYGLNQSMSQRGNYSDNAVIERFFKNFKDETISSVF
jgi:transposase InsO family protein